jgi:kumamolisin
MANPRRVALNGSERIPLKGARAIGPTDPHQLIEISVILKHRQPLETARSTGKFMTHSEFAAQFGADPAHVDMIKKFAQDNKLQVLERGDEVLRRTVTLAGTAANMEKVFGIELIDYDHPDGYYRGRIGTIQLPEDIAPFVKGVFGLDDRPVARPHFRYRGNNRSFGTRASDKSFSPTDVAKLYDFPQDVNGTGQVIGLIELGGGYRPADIQDYFKSLGLPAPQVKTSSVDQVKNRPSTADSADGEVMLDIEVAGAVAPGATIVVYFAPNTTRGFQDALSMAVHDQLRNPCVISISWGGPESGWTDQSMQNFDDVAQEAGMLGITVTVAAGDNGSSDGVDDNLNHVDFPASSPHVLAAGGTRLIAANSAISNETVWNDGSKGGATGGGFSTFFARPDYQASDVNSPNRGVPDVAGDADPETGYNVLVDGQQMVVGGTSAVAPLWAGLIALINQKIQSRLGFINPALYSMDESMCFHDIASGNNGSYNAGPGWDPTTGLGSPVGIQIMHTMMGIASQTAVEKGEKATRTHSSTSR